MSTTFTNISLAPLTVGFLASGETVVTTAKLGPGETFKTVLDDPDYIVENDRWADLRIDRIR